MRKSTKISFIAVFAAFHATLYFLSFDLWRNWAIYLIPIEGFILGPEAGFFAALIGSVIGRAIKPTDLWMFGIVAEPLGVLVCGLLAKGRWKLTISIYAVMLAAYFVHPFGRWLPPWTILDIIVAMILIYPVSKIGRYVYEEHAKRSSIAVVAISFIGIVMDSLTRVFLLVPVGLYSFFKLSPEELYVVFVGGAINSYIEDALVVAIALLVGVPLLMALRKLPAFRSLP